MFISTSVSYTYDMNEKQFSPFSLSILEKFLLQFSFLVGVQG